MILIVRRVRRFGCLGFLWNRGEFHYQHVMNSEEKKNRKRMMTENSFVCSLELKMLFLKKSPAHQNMCSFTCIEQLARSGTWNNMNLGASMDHKLTLLYMKFITKRILFKCRVRENEIFFKLMCHTALKITENACAVCVPLNHRFSNIITFARETFINSTKSIVVIYESKQTVNSVYPRMWISAWRQRIVPIKSRKKEACVRLWHYLYDSREKLSSRDLLFS